MPTHLVTPGHFRAPRRDALRILLFSFFSFLVSATSFASDAEKSFDIPAGDAAVALKHFSKQSGAQVVFPMADVKGVKTAALRGTYPVEQGLEALLSGTGLVVSYDAKSTTFAVTRERTSEAREERSPNDRSRLANAEAAEPLRAKVAGASVKLDTFEVFGSKLLNADLPRSQDDIQPYVVFNRDQLEAANSVNLEDFFRTRLPMNNTGSGTPPGHFSPLAVSTIGLRGLSAAQTLILIDGRRAPSRGGLSSISQADINGIPMSMIERIEILPSTASGIYGGGATGGVINIITRKDYSGVEATLSYTNTFDTDTAIKRADLNGSWSLEGGKTFLTLSSSYSTSNLMQVQDRDFIWQSRNLQLANNPAAFYAATTPPAGYTSNIRSQNGSNLILKPQYGGTALGSPITFVPVGFAGLATSGATPLIANAGKYNLDFSRAPGTSGQRNSLGVAREVQSLALSLRRKFGERVEIYTDYSAQNSYGRNSDAGILNSTVTLPATAPNNPFTVPIVVAWPPTNISELFYAFSNTRRAVAGISVKLPRDWTIGIDFNWGQSRTASLNPGTLVGDPDGAGPRPSFNTALSDGTLDVMRDLNAYPLNYDPYRMPKPGGENRGWLTSKEWVGRASGPIWKLPAGEMVLSGSLNRKNDAVPPTVNENTANVPSTYGLTAQVASRNDSGYLEVRAPIFAETGKGLLRALELHASTRYDKVDLFGRKTAATISVAGPDGPFPPIDFQTRKLDAFSKTVGLKYAPVRDITLRSSWGTGFLAPGVSQLSVSSSNSAGLTVMDPKRGSVLGSTGPITNEGIGNPNLDPEYSKNISAGVVLTPRFLSGLRLSLDLTRIDKTDEIASLTTQQLFDFEDMLPGRIVRDPLTAQDQALGYTGGRVTVVRSGPVNVARKKITAYDIQVDYHWRNATLGQFKSYVLATYQPQLASQPVLNASFVELIGFSGGGVKLRGNAGLDWRRGRWAASWTMQYYDSYYSYTGTATAAIISSTILNLGSARVPSQNYHDVSLSYHFGAHSTDWSRYLRNTRLTFGVQNVFNTSPPISASTFPQTGFSLYGDPRLARYSITLRRQF